MIKAVHKFDLKGGEYHQVRVPLFEIPIDGFIEIHQGHKFVGIGGLGIEVDLNTYCQIAGLEGICHKTGIGKEGLHHPGVRKGRRTQIGRETVTAQGFGHSVSGIVKRGDSGIDRPAPGPGGGIAVISGEVLRHPPLAQFPPRETLKAVKVQCHQVGIGEQEVPDPPFDLKVILWRERCHAHAKGSRLGRRIGRDNIGPAAPIVVMVAGGDQNDKK